MPPSPSCPGVCIERGASDQPRHVPSHVLRFRNRLWRARRGRAVSEEMRSTGSWYRSRRFSRCSSCFKSRDQLACLVGGDDTAEHAIHGADDLVVRLFRRAAFSGVERCIPGLVVEPVEALTVTLEVGHCERP